VLLGRNEVHLRANAADLIARGARVASVRCVDLARPPDYDALVSDLASSEGPPDEVLIAYGTLEQGGRAVGDLAYARDLIETNFTSVACWLLAYIARWDHSQPLTLIVVGSVAGDRGRARNFVYGSAKGGIDRFLEGLQQAYAGTKLRVVRVKPGFVDTPMTADIAKAGRGGGAKPAAPRPWPRSNLYALVLVADHDNHPTPAALRLPSAEDLKGVADAAKHRRYRRGRSRRPELDPASQGATPH
jgi:NAD(P)-dependent dehydrogenase (short-subunit alcohol dehydrogenase family)